MDIGTELLSRGLLFAELLLLRTPVNLLPTAEPRISFPPRVPRFFASFPTPNLTWKPVPRFRSAKRAVLESTATDALVVGGLLFDAVLSAKLGSLFSFCTCGPELAPLFISFDDIPLAL